MPAPESAGEMDQPTVDLPSLLPDLMDTLLKADPNSKRHAVMDRRFALSGGEELTLEETGKAAGGVTRERARQLQEKALKLLHAELLPPPSESSSLDPAITQEIRNLQDSIARLDAVITEDDLFTYVHDRYDHEFTDREKAYLRLLWALFGYRRILLEESRPIWEIRKSTLNVTTLEVLGREAKKLVQATREPVSYAELLRSLRAQNPHLKVSYESVRLVLAVNKNIEALDNNRYRTALPTGRDPRVHAYWVLSNSPQTAMSLDSIAAKINQGMQQFNRDPLAVEAIERGMIHDPLRFVKVPPDGEWALLEWAWVQAGLVADIMQCFEDFGRRARVDEMYKCVRATRPGLNRRVIAELLRNRREFVHIMPRSYRPRAWGPTHPDRQRKVRGGWSTQRYAEAIVEVFEEHNTDEMLLLDLAKALSEKTGKKLETIRFSVLMKTPTIRKESLGYGSQKVAVLKKKYRMKRPTES